jgi:Na+/phosphate symporter
MILALSQIFAALGLVMYAMSRLNAAVKKFPLDKMLDILMVVFRNPLRSVLFGLGSSILMCSALPHYLIVSSLISMKGVNIYHAYLVVLWANVGFLILFYLTMIPVKAIVFLLIGLLGFILTLDQPKHLMGALETTFGLCLFIFACILLSQGFAYFGSSEWFKKVLSETKVSHVLIYLFGMLLWFGLKSIWISLLVAAGAIEVQHYQPTQILAFLSGTTTAISAYGIYTLSLKKGGFKQLSVLNIAFYGICAVFEIMWCWIALITQSSKVFDWILALGDTSRLICINLHMTCLVLSALVLSLFRPYVSVIIDRYWPIEEVEDPAKYLDEQATGSPEIAMDMVQNEQIQYLEPLNEYIDIIRNRPRGMLDRFEHIHDNFTSFHHQVEIFLTELVDKQVSDQMVERFLNMSIRQKVFKSLEAEIFQFTVMNIPNQENPRIRSIMEGMLEALDVAILNLRDVLEGENGTGKVDQAIFQTLLCDRSAFIEDVRKSFLEKQSEFTLGEKKDVFEATLHFERSLWFIEQITKQVNDRRYRFAEHLETKQRWLNQLMLE